MSGRLATLTGRMREARRRWNKYRYFARGRTGVDLNRIEESILHHLYTEKARELGLSVVRAGSVLIIRGGNGHAFHTHGVWTDFDTLPLGEICGDKALTREILAREGLRVPEGAVFSRRDRHGVWRYVQSLTGPAVVKPARGTSSGRGVTVAIQKKRDVSRAFATAGLFCSDVLVERFAIGENYRLLVYKGKTISAILRDLPAVVGDGASRVRELIDRENTKRIRSSQWQPGDPVLMPLPRRRLAVQTLAEKGLSLESIPASGVVVRVAGMCNYAHGTSYREVISLVHPAVLEAAERASMALHLTLSGVDIISPDISGIDYVINEVNTTPGLESHYFVTNQEERTDPIRLIFADQFNLRP